MLLDQVVGEARAAGGLELRLYAHESNIRAMKACRRCGFEGMPYLMMRHEP